ncbi:MAG TPA: phosphatase PAP2 family protein [Candidatus Acidoferrales bacterium]|nr:phosphatase PAP2 family protein [Candidatus Acidoferrales bacterium]
MKTRFLAARYFFVAAILVAGWPWRAAAQSAATNTSSEQQQAANSNAADDTAAPPPALTDANTLGAKSDEAAQQNQQNQDEEPAPVKPTCDISSIGPCFHDLLHDQAGIWTSPFRLHAQDALWLLPLGAAVGVSIHYDPQTMTHVSTDPHRIRVSTHISNAGAYGSVGLLGVMYVIGRSAKNDTMRETGLLGLEAVADAAIVTEVLKYATNRERPNEALGTGRFWPTGTRNYPTGASMPSLHATVTAAFARVVAEETPGKIWIHLAVYALAVGVDVTRVTAREHFPSDAIVGSAIGYLVGGYVYRQHSQAANGSANNFVIAPIYDAPTRSYGMTAVMDPSVVRSWVQHLPFHKTSE